MYAYPSTTVKEDIMLKKKVLYVLSAAAVAVSMATGTVGTVFAKDTGISGIYKQGSTIKTFMDTDYEGYGSVELGYEYLTLPEYPSATFGLIAFKISQY